jgi:uncharacterized protein (TIGR02266 family)
MPPVENEIPVSVLSRYFRVPTGGIAVDYPGRELLLGSRITNLSLNGVFIRTGKPLDEGTQVTIEFRLPGVKQSIKADAIVRWRASGEESGSGDATGMGLEFTKLGKRDQKAIERYVRAFIERMRNNAAK